MCPTSSHAPRCVIVADDDEEMRTLVAASLRLDGYQVVEASDGADLLARLEEQLTTGSALVVVTDVLMPHLSGLGVLVALHRSGRRVPVILMTALADESVATVAKRHGAVTIFRKPLDIDDLRTAVMNAQSVVQSNDER